MSRSNGSGLGGGGPNTRPPRAHDQDLDPRRPVAPSQHDQYGYVQDPQFGYPPDAQSGYPPEAQGYPPEPNYGYAPPAPAPAAAPRTQPPRADGYSYPTGQPYGSPLVQNGAAGGHQHADYGNGYGYQQQPPADPRYAPAQEPTVRTGPPTRPPHPGFAHNPAPQAYQPPEPAYDPAPHGQAANGGYEPQLGGYPPAQRQSAYQQHDPRYADPYASDPRDAGRGQSVAPQMPDLRAQDPRSAPYDPYAATPDPRSYDLGAYTPHGQVQPGASNGRGPMPTAPAYDDGQWHDPNAGYGQQPIQAPYPQQQPAQANALAPYPQAAAADEDYDEEPPRRGAARSLMIVGALVGAIAIGGGLAYAYKSFVAPKTASKAIPTVKGPVQPTKTAPTDPGGKRFPNADTKLTERLPAGDGAPPPPTGIAVQPPPAPDGDPGAKRVPTFTIARDGQPVAPTQVVSGLPPGTVVVNGGVQIPVAALPPPAGPRPQPPAAAPPPPVARAAPAPVPPQVISRVPEPVAPPPAPPPAAVAAPKKPKARPAEDAFVAPKDVVAPVVAPKEKAAPAAVAPPPAAKKTRASNGYVAVVSSHRTTGEALAAVADLQQRHSGVVGGKLVDVQEYDATSTGKGVWYRAVVGPPGSRQAVEDVCGQLKTSGVTNCFAAPF